MRARMMIFASTILFLGVMLGTASAQSTITCTVSGTLHLVAPRNVVKCVTGGVIIWEIADLDSSTLQVTYYSNGDYYNIALAQGSLTKVTDGTAYVDVTQGTISNNDLPVTLTGYSD